MARQRPWLKGMATAASVAVAVMVVWVSPVDAVFTPTKKAIRKIAKKVANKVSTSQIEALVPGIATGIANAAATAAANAVQADLVAHKSAGEHSRIQVAPSSEVVAVDVTGGSFGLRLTNASADAVRVLESGDDGIQIGSSPDYPNYGVYIPAPGVSTYGLWPNTAQAAGEWALFTVDKISAGNVSASSQTTLARVAESESLQAGDVVSAVGVGAPISGAGQALPLVEAATTATAWGIIGVVESRMALVSLSGKGERGLHSRPGPAGPGDLVAVTVLGVAEVRVVSDLHVSPGQPLAVAGRGSVRSLDTVSGQPSVGIALGAPDARGTVPVFVDPR